MPENDQRITRNSPTFRIRHNIERNTKGYNYDTSVEMTWTGDVDTIDPETGLAPRDVLRVLGRTADQAAREEIDERRILDAEAAS